MSELGLGSRRFRYAAHQTVESKIMFGACFVLFLCRAVFKRMMPWRKQTFFAPSDGARSGHHESIFSEASTAASVCVASSFMGL